MAKKNKHRTNTISAFELKQKFPSEKEAREHLEKLRWPDGPVCPHCHEHGNNSPVKDREGQYRCRSCRKFFTVRIGAIFERSHIPLHKWIYAFYQLQTARKGISAMHLSKEIGVSYKSAWFLLHHIREACDIRGVDLSGAIEEAHA